MEKILSKICPGCDTRYNLNEFYRAGRYYQTLCKICHNASRKQYKPFKQ